MAESFSPISADPLPAGSRICCRVEYDGAGYNGWQSQPHPGVSTVQQELEAALSKVADTSLRIHCAGRTDTGVHGHAQIIHFDAPVSRAPKAWVLGANAGLPRDIRLHWAVPVPESFHARFSATARRYRYLIANTAIRPALHNGQLTWHRFPLDAQRMNEAAAALLGEQDFSAFRAAACQSTTPMREVQSVSVFRRGDLVVMDIQANAFLHHMVRNIVGVLLRIGRGSKSPEWAREVLEARDRSAGCVTAPPFGLYLVHVEYPEIFGLPQGDIGPLLASGPLRVFP